MKFLDQMPACLAAALLASSASAPGQDNKFDYDEIAQKTFWEKLYPEGGWTLYCGFHFGMDRQTADGRAIAIEHVYPTELMLKVAGCANRSECRDSGNPRFAKMEADMHNLYPVWQAMITFRAGRMFGMVTGEDWRFDDCDIEWKDKVIEPRVLARGNVARAILYMRATYGVPVDPPELQLLRRWNAEDPPSEQEKERNDLIETVQGTRNSFIDASVRAESFKQGVPQDLDER